MLGFGCCVECVCADTDAEGRSDAPGFTVRFLFDGVLNQPSLEDVQAKVAKHIRQGRLISIMFEPYDVRGAWNNGEADSE